MSQHVTAYEDRITHFLTDYADGVAPLDALLAHYALDEREVGALLALADQLRATLVEVSPDAAFVEQLYHELIGPQPIYSWWGRVQHMSPRMKLAAGIGGLTLTAGVLLITRRSWPHVVDLLSRRTDTPREVVA